MISLNCRIFKLIAIRGFKSRVAISRTSLLKFTIMQQAAGILYSQTNMCQQPVNLSQPVNLFLQKQKQRRSFCLNYVLKANNLNRTAFSPAEGDFKGGKYRSVSGFQMKKTFNNHFGSPTRFEKQHYIRRYFLFLFKNAEVSNLLFLLQLQSKGGI